MDKSQAKVALNSICFNNCMNLSINKSCSIPEIDQVFQTIKKAYNFYNSAKRIKILTAIKNQQIDWKICKCSAFVKNIKSISSALKHIIENDFSSAIKQTAYDL